MVKVTDLFEAQRLEQMVSEGYITLREHATEPLVVANYSKSAQFEWVWNEVTSQCRGLIWNTETLEVIARPFEKFHNYDQSGTAYPPSGPVIRMEKVDGSLGILYKAGNVYAIATRGSFYSEQAEFATEFFTNTDVGFVPKEGRTYLWEIVYPANRIVVDYGDYEGLILLDVINNETGFPDTDEFDDCVWPEKVTRTPLPGFDSGQMADVPPGEEGFVYLWPARNLRIKLKSAEYIYLHRLISNLNEKTIWEQLVANKTLDDIKIGLPEEFHGYIDKHGKAMLGSAQVTMAQAYEAYSLIKDLPTRKAQALALANSSVKSYVFRLLGGKEIWLDCLKAQKPVKNNPLVKDE